MSYRYLPLVSGEVYHIYNRGVDRRPTFTSRPEFKRAIQVIRFYRRHAPTISLSRYLGLDYQQQRIFIYQQQSVTPLVEVLAYCLMPNHYHFLLRQTTDGGISQFISQFQNSYTRYFNLKHRRSGPLFSGPFKGVHIEDQEQLMHVSRYIHLNPYTAYLIRRKSELETYPWSSLADYLSSESDGITSTSQIIQSFSSGEDYRSFILNQADYQRKLTSIRHLLLEESDKISLAPISSDQNQVSQVTWVNNPGG